LPAPSFENKGSGGLIDKVCSFGSIVLFRVQGFVAFQGAFLIRVVGRLSMQILLWNKGILYKGVARITKVYRFSKISELLRSRG
jgi:hypothetical protein